MNLQSPLAVSDWQCAQLHAEPAQSEVVPGNGANDVEEEEALDDFACVRVYMYRRCVHEPRVCTKACL